MKTTVLAVIGCGRIARNAHLPAFSRMKDIRVKWACDIIPEKAEKLKEDFPFIENTETDYHKVLSDKEVEAVYVLTPNYAHYTITMDALKAGKHVFCEKPITVNYDLSCAMAKEAEARKKMLNIGVCNRYNRSIELLKQYAEEGRFGQLYHVYCSFRSFRSIPGLGGAFTTKSQSGGGVLIDWGVHFFDLILYILGNAKLKNVTCDAYSETAKNMQDYKYYGMWAEDTKDIENGTNDVEDFITGYIRTDRASISFNGAWAQNVDRQEMYIDFLGDKGGARLDYGGKFTFWDAKTLERIEPDYEITDMYQNESVGFIRSIRTMEKDRNNIENVLQTAKLLDVLYQSSREHKEILVES
ncbi:MAG: Gfo/Idh/MocA family oxidoreductase [Clostridia bacterium]|nr:Gfo/Idh/MocA family oxidoreductase [Clostridia bacterium]